MAQYDIILAQNVHATGIEFTEQAVNLTENQLVIGNANKLPSSFANGTSKYYLRTNAGATAPEWKLMAGTPETSFTLNEDGSTNKLKLQAGGTGNFTLTVQTPTLTAARTQTFQDKDGIIALKSDITDAIGTNDAMVYKGVIDASTNPNYPAADAGWTYKISVAGKIGGASGINVEVGDMLICTADATASGTHAAVGTSWNIIQMNIDGYVLGPASSTNNNIAVFDGTTGKLIKDGGSTIATLTASLKNNLLDGINHLDTTTGTVQRGDLITGQGTTPKWTRLAKGTANQVLSMDGTGTDIVWAAPYSHPALGSLSNAVDTVTTLSSIKIIGGDNPLTLSNNHITGYEYRTLAAGTNISITAALNGTITINNTYSYTEWVAAPSSKTATGTVGQKAYDANYLYICTATNTWCRVPLAKNW